MRFGSTLGRGAWKGWLLAGFMLLVLQGTGPCYSDECSNPGEGWCDGQVAAECAGAGMNQAYWLRQQDCGASGLTCVAGQGQGYRGAQTKLSWCLDVQPCEAAGHFQCGSNPVDGAPTLMRCVDIASTQWYSDNAIARFTTPLDMGLVLEPLSPTGFGDVAAPVVACQECTSTCGCDVDTVCRDGWCVPMAVVGEADENLFCCGRERMTDCPSGQACELPDGTMGACQQSARCGACQSALDCESADLTCASTGGDLPPVCLLANDFGGYTYECRSPEEGAWKRDKCGQWVESAHYITISYSCREGTNQSWSQDACGDWIHMAQDCGDGHRCEANQCIAIFPAIEVSPSLMDFDDVQVGTTKTLDLSIGNVGEDVLHVSSVQVQSSFASMFSISQAPDVVAVDEIATVGVTFAPSAAGPVTAKIVVYSNDPDEPQRTVLINGNGVE